MVDKTWEQRTDDTLDRIETQTDDGTKQAGFALDFREKVVTSLAKIEGSMEQNVKDHVEIKAVLATIPIIEKSLALIEQDNRELKDDLKDLKLGTDKIPKMEIGLNNHLHAHDILRKSFYYPVAVIIAIAILGVLGRLVLKVF